MNEREMFLDELRAVMTAGDITNWQYYKRIVWALQILTQLLAKARLDITFDDTDIDEMQDE